MPPPVSSPQWPETAVPTHRPMVQAALNAGLGAPIAVSVDVSYTLAISEYTNARIRLVDPNTGILSTFAGNGSTTFTGDGVPAPSAGIGRVAVNLVTDGKGNTYFPDGTGRIRRVDAATRTIVTVAGNGSGAQGLGTPCIGTLVGDNGPATNATLDGPYAVAYAMGFVLFTDSLDCRLRIVSLPSPNHYTNTTLTASSVNINQGDPVTFTAAATSIPVGGVPTGYVQFIDQPQGSAPIVLGTAVLSGGSASLTSTTLSSTSAHLIGAYYMGDSLFNGSGSPGVAVTVAPAVSKPSPIIGMSAPMFATVNVPTSISVTVSTPYGSTAQPAGSVVLNDGSALLQAAIVVNGVAQFTVTFTALGDHFLTAAYQGDSNYSQVRTQSDVTVKSASTAALTSNPNPSTQGTAVTFTATMAPSTATGFVEIHYDGNMLCIATIANGVATCSVSWLPAGTHSIQGFYNGDSALMGSNSTILTQIVKTTTTTTVTSSASPSAYGQAVTFTATVSPATATGTIQFMNGATSLGSASLSAGSATITVSTLAAGTQSIAAIYSGDDANAASTSAVFSQTVQQANVTMTLTCSPNPSTAGQPVACSATLSSTAATGTMRFLDGSTEIVTGTVLNGAGGFSVSSFSAGSHSITGVYSGDTNFNGMTSAAMIQRVNKIAATTTLSSITSTIAYGQTVDLTASVSPAAATGTVQFLDGGAVLGTAPVSGGTAALSVSTLAAGSHSLTAAYSGDPLDAASTSSALAITVNKAASSATLISPLNPAVVGQSLTFTATVAPDGATGTVQFLDGTTVMGTAVLSNGAAAFATSSLAVGDHSVTATYPGDGNVSPSRSTAVLQQVVKRATTSTLVSAPNSSTVGMTVTLTATVSPSTATGTVQFLNGATVLGSAALANGSAQLAVANLPAGSNSLSAVYGGDGANAGSTSIAVTQTVGKANSTTTLAGPTSHLNVGQGATFTATVRPSSATGSVQFLDGALAIGTVAVNGGTAVFSTTALTAGSHSITAAYSGDGALDLSTSAAIVVQVVKYATTTSLDSSPSLQVFTGHVSLIASVFPPTASGSVQYYDGAAVLGSATIVNGQAILGVSNLTAGPHMLTAVYGGDARFAGSTSRAVRQMIAQAASTTTISSTPPGQSSAGQTVTFTATVAPAAATGSVQFRDGGATMATTVLMNGMATFSTSALKNGNHSITAAYLGDSNVAASESATLKYRIKP